MSENHEDKSDKTTFINANRRGFLQGAAVAGGVAATGVAVAGDAVNTSSDAIELPTQGKGYEVTDHVRKYYKRARF